MPFQVHQDTIVLGADIHRENTTRSQEAAHNNRIPPTNKNELQFSGIMNYLGMFLPWPAEVCEPLRKLMLSKYKWTWNNTYQNLYDKVKNIINKKWKHDILEWKETVVSGSTCIGCRSRSKSFTSEGWNATPKEWSTKQCNAVTNSIHNKSLTSA